MIGTDSFIVISFLNKKCNTFTSLNLLIQKSHSTGRSILSKQILKLIKRINSAFLEYNSKFYNLVKFTPLL